MCLAVLFFFWGGGGLGCASIPILRQSRMCREEASRDALATRDPLLELLSRRQAAGGGGQLRPQLLPEPRLRLRGRTRWISGQTTRVGNQNNMLLVLWGWFIWFSLNMLLLNHHGHLWFFRGGPLGFQGKAHGIPRKRGGALWP